MPALYFALGRPFPPLDTTCAYFFKSPPPPFLYFGERTRTDTPRIPPTVQRAHSEMTRATRSQTVQNPPAKAGRPTHPSIPQEAQAIKKTETTLRWLRFRRSAYHQAPQILSKHRITANFGPAAGSGNARDPPAVCLSLIATPHTKHHTGWIDMASSTGSSLIALMHPALLLTCTHSANPCALCWRTQNCVTYGQSRSVLLASAKTPP